tara:strand:+ start:191 stop:847 length:657 start_codon:yes stop_codon:yes gene_type:complete
VTFAEIAESPNCIYVAMEDIIVPMRLLTELKLGPSLYCYLYTLNKRIPFEAVEPSVRQQMDTYLQQHGWLVLLPNTPRLTPKAEDMLADAANNLPKPVVKAPDSYKLVNDWIDDWRELWPAKQKSGGRRIRGDKQGVTKKMTAFLCTYPKTTKEEIFEATKQYLHEKRQVDWKMISCADYFISKNGTSLLAGAVEEVSENGTNYTESSGADSVWFTSA